jgi:hypothetical protein
MKRAVLMVLVVILFCIPLLSCVKDEEDPAIAAMKAEITTLKNTITTTNNNVASLQTGVTEAKNNATAALNKANQVSTPDLSSYSTKATVPQNLIDNLTAAQIDTLKAKLGITTSSSSGTQTPSNPTGVTGQVTATILNSGTLQISSVTSDTQPSIVPISCKLFNNTNTSRYVMPILRLSQAFNIPAGTLTNAKAYSSTSSGNIGGNMAFNGLAQGPTTNVISVNFQPSGDTVNTVVGPGGIINTGEYLMPSGAVVDFTIIIWRFQTQNAAIWTPSLTFSDRVAQ